MTLTPQAREKAEKALNLIQAGWTQGQSHRITEEPGGFQSAFCMVGANFHACHMIETQEYTDLAYELAAVIRAQYPEIEFADRTGASVVIHFNDYPKRTQDQVVAVYEKLLAGE